MNEPHLAQQLLDIMNRENPEVFKTLDKWRESPIPNQPWCFLTALQCEQWLTDYLRHNPVPEVGMLSRETLAKHQPHIAFITMAAWRTGKSIIRCDDDLRAALDKTGLNNTLASDVLFRLPFWGFYLELPLGEIPLPQFEADGLTADGVFITLTEGNGTDLVAYPFRDARRATTLAAALINGAYRRYNMAKTKWHCIYSVS